MYCRAALGILLGGSCYHMASVLESDRDHQHWRRAILGQTKGEDWHQVLAGQGYRAGVDYPVSVFYKEILAAYPDAKVGNFSKQGPNSHFGYCIPIHYYN